MLKSISKKKIAYFGKIFWKKLGSLIITVIIFCRRAIAAQPEKSRNREGR